MNTRKFLSIICVLTLCLSGCGLLPQKQPANEPQLVYVDGLKYRSEFEKRMQYEYLNADEQHNYGLLYTSVKDAIDTDATVEDDNGNSRPGVRVLFDTALTETAMSHLYECFLRDNPQFFFLDRTYSLEGHQAENGAVYDTIILQFTLGKKERLDAIERLNTAVENILSNHPVSADEYETEKHLHDYLISHCTYDEAAGSNADAYENAYSAYGALVDQRAVCEGYAKAMQLLLNEVSIPATVLIGRSSDTWESHMWNLVRINGSYYHLDVTWDDNEDAPQYTYFNVTDTVIQRTHQPDEGQFDDITCTETKDNYFVRTGTYCDTYERASIAKAIATRIEAGDTVIHLQFAPGKYENALLFLKNKQLTQKMTNAQLGNRKKMWDYALSTHAKQLVITITQTE